VFYIFVENDIIRMHIANASNTISESDYGIHTLVVYEDLEKLREFYSHYVKKRLRKKTKLFNWHPFMKLKILLEKRYLKDIYP
jgi:hypothetical protein